MPLPLLAGPVAFLAKPLVKWGIVALAIGGLILAVIWFKHEAAAAKKGEAAALAQLASATERANANHDAAEIMRLQVEADKRTISMQGEEVEKWKADSFAMKARNDALVRQARDDRSKSLAEIAAKEAEIKALSEPDVIHRLSPPVKAMAKTLEDE